MNRRALSSSITFSVAGCRLRRVRCAGAGRPEVAKGLNLALRDVGLLAEALVDFFTTGSTTLLASYSERSLRRVWRCEHFSWWMTSMLHTAEDASPFERKLQVAQLRYTVGSTAAATSFAENYVGLAPA